MKKYHSKNITPYTEETYKGIQINYLIVFGIYSVLAKREKCTFEKLVAECFNLFPKTFSFARYPQWPDSIKFDRPLRTLREKGLIIGNPRGLFSLTKFGEKMAKDTAKVLKIGGQKKVPSYRFKRDAEVNLITSLKTSEVFQRFLKNKDSSLITEMEVRNLLHCTLETPSRIVKQNLTYAKNLAKEFNEELLFNFLDLCYQKLGKK
jgi:hypothetical protein